MKDPISPRAAQRDYPHAWAEVERQIAEVKSVSDADIIALGAVVIEVESVKTLEVTCLTDLVHDDDEMPASGLRFYAPIHDAARLKKLH